MFANSILPQQLKRFCVAAIAVVTLTLLGFSGFAPETELPSIETSMQASRRANDQFEVARRRFSSTPTNLWAATEFARACFDRAEFASNATERAGLAVQGIAACRQVINQATHFTPGHYYLGMNLGQLARTRMLGALPLVDEMEVEFKLARQLDETFDHAGPDRNLGLLYSQAPTIGSIGSRSKGRRHLRRAAELAPTYPDNQLNLIEAYLRWTEHEEARRQLEQLETVLPTARTNFTGPDWSAAWQDWNQRLTNTRALLSKSIKPGTPAQGRK